MTGEQEAFEKYFDSITFNFDFSPHPKREGQYASYETQCAWWGWQARGGMIAERGKEEHF